MRHAQVILATLLVCVILGGGFVTYRIWLRQQHVASILADLPPRPDLRRWPVELQRRVDSSYEAVRRGKPPAEPLAELAELYLANDYRIEAEKTLHLLRRLDPANSRWPYFIGVIRARANDAAGAEQWFTATLETAPDYAPALIQLGQLRAKSGNTDEARKLFEHHQKLLPQNPESEYELAKLNYARGDLSAAMARLQSVTTLQPKFQEAHLMFADLLEKNGDVRRAAEQRTYLRGGRPSPPSADPWLDEIYLLSYDAYRLQAFGAMQLEAGEDERAIPYLQRALSLDPTDVDVIEALAKCYSDLKRWPEAQRVIENGLERAPQSERLHVWLAQILNSSGRPIDALASLDDAIRRLRTTSLLLSAKGEILLRLGRPAESVEALQAALQANSTLVEAQLNLGRAQLKLGNREDGKQAVLRALLIRPDDRDALGLLSSIELEDREYEAADEHVTQLLTLDPTKPEALELFTRIKLQKGNVEAEGGRNAQAEKTYRQGLERNPSFAQLHGALGMLYGKERRFPEAIGEFRRYVELAPYEPFGYALLGSALASTGNVEEARTVLHRGLDAARAARNAPRAAQLEKLLRPLER